MIAEPHLFVRVKATRVVCAPSDDDNDGTKCVSDSCIEYGAWSFAALSSWCSRVNGTMPWIRDVPALLSGISGMCDTVLSSSLLDAMVGRGFKTLDSHPYARVRMIDLTVGHAMMEIDVYDETPSSSSFASVKMVEMVWEELASWLGSRPCLEPRRHVEGKSAPGILALTLMLEAELLKSGRRLDKAKARNAP